MTPNPRGVFCLDMAPKPKHIDCMRRSEEESFIDESKCGIEEERIVNETPGEVVHENPYIEEEPEIKDEEPVIEDDEPVSEDDEPVCEDDEPVIEDMPERPVRQGRPPDRYGGMVWLGMVTLTHNSIEPTSVKVRQKFR